MRGGVVVGPILQDVRTLQPVLTIDQISARATEFIYDLLIDWEPTTGAPRPRLGSWRTSDGRTYEWQLASATWTDGRPIVAADYLTTMKAFARSRKAGAGKKQLFARIEGFQEYAAGRTDSIAGIELDDKDPRRFAVRLVSSFCPVLRIFSVLPLPAHVFDKYLSPSADDAIDRAPENDSPTVTSGAFTVGEWRRGERLRLVRNPSYWRGAPYLDAWEFKLMGSYDFASWAEQLRTGAMGFLALNVGDRAMRDALSRVSEVRVHTGPSADYTYLAWNTRSVTAPGLSDRRIRQALAYGLDMDVVIRDLLGGSGTRHVSHHLPSHWAYPTGLHEYAHDPARARSLIEAAGYSRGPDGYYAKDGRVLGFSLETNKDNPTRAGLVQLAADQYASIGVKVTPVLREFEQLVDRLTSGAEIEAIVIGWTLTPDPDAYDIWHSTAVPQRGTGGNNFTRFSDPRVDAALAAGRDGPDCAIAVRKAQYDIVNRILNEEQPYNFGFVAPKTIVTSARLRGYRPGPFADDFFDVHRWWLAPEKK